MKELYYIRGNKYNPDGVLAALENKGGRLSHSSHNFSRNVIFYINENGYISTVYNKQTRGIIEAFGTELHPFKPDPVDELKDGDYCVEIDKDGNRIRPFIFSHMENRQSYAYYGLLNADDMSGHYENHCEPFHWTFHPVVKADLSERKRIDDALRGRGSIWDPVLKKVVSIRENTVLKPYDRVLCMSENKWRIGLYERHVSGEMHLCMGFKCFHPHRYEEWMEKYIGTSVPFREFKR